MDTYDSVVNEWLEAFNASFLNALHGENMNATKKLFMELCVFYKKMNDSNLGVARQWLESAPSVEVRADDMGWDIDDPMFHSVVKSFMRL
jgi:hypothetical protein